MREVIPRNMRKLITSVFLGISLITLGLPSAAVAQRREAHDTKSRVVAAFGFECLTDNFPRKNLQRVIRRAMRQVEGEAEWRNGEIAVAYDLNGDGREEYFVQLKAMGTGDNIIWGIFALRPARLLGIIPAEHIYVRERVGGWAALTASWHESVSDSSVTTFAYRDGRYVRVAGGYQISAYRNDHPKFMERTTHLYLCKRESQNIRIKVLRWAQPNNGMHPTASQRLSHR